ncbi:MAG: hypothetical protein ABI834_07665 [Ginsengibacter sp.]
MKIKALLFSAFILFIISCKKSENTTISKQDKYLTTSAGSTWNYHETNSSGPAPVNTDYTLTSTSRDTSINNKSYHIFTNSTGSTRYLSISGNDYYQFDSLPSALGTAALEILYLKDNISIGGTWSQNTSVTLPGVPFPVPITLSYNIAEKGISRSVNGNNYTGVIHVTTSISSSLIPAASLTTNINSYYAEKYGLIESSNIIQLNYLGFVQNVSVETKLVSANLL